jgi:HEAT repeat protein
MDQDKRIGRVLALSEDDKPDPELADNLLEKLPQVAEKFGYQELLPELRLELAMESASVLELIAAGASYVYDVRVAEPALIQVLIHPSEELRIKALQVLSLLDTDVAQRAIAKVALSSEQTESLRLKSFGTLADSARRFGSHLDQATIDVLTELALGEPDLIMRTAAGKALGALNLPSRRAADIILQPKD